MLSFAIWLGGFLGSLFFQEGPKRPNVLLILTDDQGYGDIAVHENGMVETPVLDNFAKTAAQFEHFYCSQLNPVNTLPLDGISLAKTLLGTPQMIDRQIFTHVAQPEKNIKPFPGAVRTNEHRLIVTANGIELYDMLADPQQEIDISKKSPAIAEDLYQSYQAWFAAVSKDIKPQQATPLSPKTDRIELPTYESTFSGTLTFKEGHGWVHDWLINWTSEKDSIFWEVESPANQHFIVKIDYTCPADQVGSKVRLSIGNQILIAKITTAFDPEMIPSPDRIKRKEVYQKNWKTLILGKVTIPKGISKIVLTAPKVAKNQVAELKSISLVRSGR